MHILVVNDDGPPSTHASPYVHSLVRALQASGHVVSVCLPHTQRSWIGKAHMIGQSVRPTYYRPPSQNQPPAGIKAPPPGASADSEATFESVGETNSRPHPRSSVFAAADDAGDDLVEEWVLVDGTPASCAQIGLYHFFQQRGPVDLVLSGPNYGRNTTAAFALSSGTLGGALEAAICRRRAIALSYAFFTRNHDPAIIAEATGHAVRVVEALCTRWPTDGSVDVYSVNVPLVEGVSANKTLWTDMLQNYWGNGSCFTEVEAGDPLLRDGQAEEEKIREGKGGETDAAGNGGNGADAETKNQQPHKLFKWAPRFQDVYKSVEEAPPGNDGWAVKEGFTSVTALKANFFQTVQEQHGQELQL